MKKLKYVFVCFAVLILGLSGLCFLSTDNFVSSTDIAIETSKIENKKDDVADDDIEEIVTTYEKKSYEDYFTDFNISEATMTEADFTGTGTKNDPYEINSTKGYIYLTTLSWYGKYLNLNCDVVLNDEIFGADGSIAGGSGEISYYYEWTKTVGNQSSYVTFNGNGHTIYGLYFNDTSVTWFAGVCYSATLVCDLNLENVFFNGGLGCFPLAATVDEMYNCHNKSGYFATSTYSHGAGCTGSVKIRIENCTNRASFNSNSGIAGVLQANAVAKNCINYGNSTGDLPVAGCFGNADDGVLIENCINYGNITASQNANGGVLGIAQKSIVIRNCENYGDITNNTPFVSGGIVGAIGKFNVTIDGAICKGKILGNNNNDKGILIGNIMARADSNISKANIIIKNIKATLVDNDSLIGSNAENVKVTSNILISNSHIVDKRSYANSYGVIMEGSWAAYFEISISNTIFDITNAKQCLFNSFQKYGAKVSCKNVIMNYTTTNSSFAPSSVIIKDKTNLSKYLDQWSISSIIVNGNVNGVKKLEYYGSDFSGYYVSWKTGKIGLKAIDGIGFYQGVVDEDVLSHKGYNKKEI